MSDAVKNMIINFHENNINSRLLPGSKEFISIKQANGTPIHVH